MQKDKLLQISYIRVRHMPGSSSKIFCISTLSSQNNQILQQVQRSIDEIKVLVRYMLKEYGGHIIPVISTNFFKNGISLIEAQIIIQEYLEDLRENQVCRKDLNYYCFLFQQAMLLTSQQSYARVLSSASKISKKYLNTIFTRKQIPQQQTAQHLLKLYQKLLQVFKDFRGVHEIVSMFIKEQRTLFEIMTSFSQLSCLPNPASIFREDLLIETQKIMKIGTKYILETKQAYERWQILVEGVRELKNNVYKGLHEDQEKYHKRNETLKNWTKSLIQQFDNMLGCFDGIIQKLCQNFGEVRFLSGVSGEEFDKKFFKQNGQVGQKTVLFTSEEQTHDKLENEKKKEEIGQISQIGNAVEHRKSIQYEGTQTTLDEVQDNLS